MKVDNVMMVFVVHVSKALRENNGCCL